jgi:fibronectin type 3 domain-containing protein
VSEPNVQLVTLKQSEQPGRGWIVRLVETEGRDTDVVVDLPRSPITSAAECDLVENDRGPLVVAGRKVKLRIGKYAFATLRVWSTDAPGRVEEVRAEALSDKSVRLRWNGSAAAYNIYRSEDPDAPPTLYSLVARTTQAEFTDDWLKIATTYHYYVAPVSISNNQGAVSPGVAGTTKTVNASPPAPVEGLGVVRRAKDRLIVYWLSSPEPDVARYDLYRGEEKDFSIAGKSPLVTVASARYFLQTFADKGLEPGRTYYYKVVAEDWAGNRQTHSPVAGATTPAY